MSGGKKKKKAAFNAVSDINVTPMVDVMLVMLIIFMVITPMLSKGISVDLAKTKNPVAMQAADKDDAILVSITKDGKAYLGTDQFANLNDMGVKVKDRLSAKLDKTVYLKNDSRARYERVVEVIDSLRGFGVDQLGLITESVAKEGAAKPAGI
ncbi:MAG: biopolymer transporter ExbD [Acidobacteria bacterium]|nr:biopolymer transporter ExbD [Acidobacteriota bacterium]